MTIDLNDTEIAEAASQICKVGKRLDERRFAAANDGNISIRLTGDRILCTPTMHSKGDMEPQDLCLVDLQGEQISGQKRRSSEVKLHLEVYRQRPDVNSVVHCHPPHATAFAVAREPIPQCVLPEVEIFLGEVPIAAYQTPGSPAFSQSILPFVKDCNVIVLANHGTVSFGTTCQLAFWYTDILDAYCRVLMLAKQLGGLNYLSDKDCGELLEYKQEWGYSDLRIYGEDAGCNVCGHQAFRNTWETAGARPRAFPKSQVNEAKFTDAEMDELAERIASRLKSNS